MNKGILIIMIVLLVISGVYFGGKMSVVNVEPGYLIHYDGVPCDSHGNSLYWWSLTKGVQSNYFVIGDYRVEIDRSDERAYWNDCIYKIPNRDLSNCHYGGNNFNFNTQVFTNPVGIECRSKGSGGCDHGSCDDGDPFYSKFLTGVEETFIDEFGCQHWNVTIFYPNIYCDPYGSGRCNYYEDPWTESDTRHCSPGANCYSKYLMNGNYDVIQYSHTETLDYGGPDWKRADECSAIVRIYKNGVLVDTLGYPPIGTSYPTLSKNTEWEDEDIFMIFLARTYTYNDNNCGAIMNEVKLKIPDEKFIVNVTDVETEYFGGENVTFRVTINNNWKDVYGIVDAKMCTPTVFGETCKVFTMSKELSTGSNVFEFEVPTKDVASEVTIEPTVGIYLDTNTFNIQNMMAWPDEVVNSNKETCRETAMGAEGQRIDINYCKENGYNLIRIGRTTESKYKVSIYSGDVTPEQPLTGVWSKINNLWSGLWAWILSKVHWT